MTQDLSQGWELAYVLICVHTVAWARGAVFCVGFFPEKGSQNIADLALQIQ